MKDILQDVVAHTHALGFLSLVKVTADSSSTVIDAMADDRSVIMSATTHSAVAEFDGTFGMPNLDKLSMHLKNPEYQKDAKLDVITGDRNGEIIPTHISFGDASTHAGNFVFQHGVTGELKHTWSWPVAAVQAILNLDGDATMSLSD